MNKRTISISKTSKSQNAMKKGEGSQSAGKLPTAISCAQCSLQAREMCPQRRGLRSRSCRGLRLCACGAPALDHDCGRPVLEPFSHLSNGVQNVVNPSLRIVLSIGAPLNERARTCI